MVDVTCFCYAHPLGFVSERRGAILRQRFANVEQDALKAWMNLSLPILSNQEGSCRKAKSVG